MVSVIQQASAADTAHVTKQFDVVMQDGVVIPVRVYGPDDAPVRVVCSHGNGMAIDGYQDFWSRLTDVFQVVVFDVRGHGDSQAGSFAHHNWLWIRRDMATLLQAFDRILGRRYTVGAFHSLTSLVSLAYVRDQGGGLDALTVFDPPLMPPVGHPWRQAHIEEMYGWAQRVVSRRAHFNDPSELAEQFSRQPALSRWQPDAYLKMARAVMRPVPDGQGWQLVCAPEREAHIFATNSDVSLYESLPNIRIPFFMVAADPQLPGVETSAHVCQAAAQQFGLRYQAIDNTTHFLQVERPDACAQALRDFIHTCV